MARYSFKMQRLFVDHPLVGGTSVLLNKAQSNYLVNVLRMRGDDLLLVFNGRDGEWHAKLKDASKKAATLELEECTRTQPAPSSLDYLFAPLKHARLDYMVQKAVEMGAGRLRPVLTAHTQVTRLNLERMRANVIEAAEQCGILSVPEVIAPIKLPDLLENWHTDDAQRTLIFCDEGDERQQVIDRLQSVDCQRLAVLIGPEGGFSDDERRQLNDCDFVTSISLGPRILRADTASVAALAVIQATIGDWDAPLSLKR